MTNEKGLNARRKISNTGRGDLESGLMPLVPHAPKAQLPESNSNSDSKPNVAGVRKTATNIAPRLKQTASSTTSCNDFFGKIMVVAIVMVVILDAYWFVIPREKKREHWKSLNDQMAKFAFSLEEKKSSVNEEIEEVNELIEEERKSLADYLPIVAKGHHELELVNLKDDHKEQIDALKGEHNEQIEALKGAHQKELEELKAEYDKLSKEKQAAVDNIQNALKKDEIVLEELKEEEATLEKDLSSVFCRECQFSYKGLSTSCGARKDYLVSAHGTPEDDAFRAVIEWDSNCRKSS